jgi:hypothetical protein
MNNSGKLCWDMIGIIHQELQPDHCHKRRNIFEVWREKKKSLLTTCFQLYIFSISPSLI